MGERANRTILNWRWWVVLPLVPVALPLIAAQWLFRGVAWLASLPVRALDDTEKMFCAAFNWSRATIEQGGSDERR